jgi:hypothetical protein
MKNALLAVPLIAAGVLAAGCAASSSSSATPPAAPATSPATAPASVAATSPATSAPAATSSAATSSAATATAAGAAGTQPCESANLQASVGGGPGPGMSQNHTGLQLRNTGSSACTLYGYPGVSYVAGADGHQVGAAATRQPDPSGSAEQTVTLAPGAVASAPLDLVDAGALPPTQCKPVPVRGLRIYPPGEKAALFIPMATPAGGYGECSLPTKNPTLFIGYIQLGVQPGNDGQG